MIREQDIKNACESVEIDEEDQNSYTARPRDIEDAVLALGILLYSLVSQTTDGLVVADNVEKLPGIRSSPPFIPL